MKSNKYAPYVLGPILLLVWGMIFYKIYQAVYGGDEEVDITSLPIPVYDSPQKEASFALLLDYKDPFLGKKYLRGGRRLPSTTVRSTKPKGTPRAPKPIRNKPQVPPTVSPKIKKPFPTIVYQGYQSSDGDTSAMLKINNRFYPGARKGQSLQKVRILGIYRDSIQLFFEGKERTFFR